MQALAGREVTEAQRNVAALDVASHGGSGSGADEEQQQKKEEDGSREGQETAPLLCQCQAMLLPSLCSAPLSCRRSVALACSSLSCCSRIIHLGIGRCAAAVP